MQFMQEIQIPKQEFVATSSLKVDGKNPNKMTKEQHERLATSMKKWGWLVDIITNKDLLIADGEQRLIVAKELGMPQVGIRRLPVEEVDRRLLRQVLNKLRGEHELLLDAEEFEAILDLGGKDDLKYLLDLTDGKLERYLNELHPPKDEDYEIPEIDKVQTEIKKGDIIQLGKHRLMCGDSTSKEETGKLTEGQLIELQFTDPPYRMETVGGGILKNANSMKQIKDNKVDTFTPSLLKPYGKTNIFFHNKPLIKEYITLAESLSEPYDLAVYKKQGVPNYAGHLMTDIEYIAIIGEQSPNLGLPFQMYSKVYEGNKDTDNKLSYSKPVELCRKFVELYSNKVVLDTFGGSGTTLIACEQTGRTCYMMEIDPRYCEIIAQRWEKYTGQKRVKLN